MSQDKKKQKNSEKADIKSKSLFTQKSQLQSPTMRKRTKEQILKVSSDSTYYCILGYN